jgi:8-oxo-dGTP diphosphatase
VVVAAVARRGETYLLCQRPSNKRHGGLWEFPGGKLKPFEDDEDAAHREFAEELGLHVRRVGPTLAERRDEGSSFLIAFREVNVEGDAECREHADARWLTVEEIVELPLAPTDRWFAERLVKTAAEAHGARR